MYVDPDIPNVPRYVNSEVGITLRKADYLDFKTTEPSANMFAIPKECQP